MSPTTLPTVEREHLDNSILQDHGRCPRLSFYNNRLSRGSLATSWPAIFGNAYHSFRETLESLYRSWVLEGEGDLDEEDFQNQLYETAFAVATRSWEDPPIDHRKSYLDVGRLGATCHDSFERWLAEKDQGHYQIIMSEAPFCLPLPKLLCRTCFQWWESDKLDLGTLCPACNEAGIVSKPQTEHFAGRLDQIIEWNNRLWVRDFKTTGWKADWSRKYNPDHQFTGYTWAAQQLSGRPVDGAIVDIIYNIKTIGPEFYPTLVNRTTSDIDHWFEWFYFEYANYRRSEVTGVWPMRTSACGDYGGCFFRDCCNAGSWSDIQFWLENHTVEDHWDPLEAGDV